MSSDERYRHKYRVPMPGHPAVAFSFTRLHCNAKQQHKLPYTRHPPFLSYKTLPFTLAIRIDFQVQLYLGMMEEATRAHFFNHGKVRTPANKHFHEAVARIRNSPGNRTNESNLKKTEPCFCKRKLSLVPATVFAKPKHNSRYCLQRRRRSSAPRRVSVYQYNGAGRRS